MTNQSSEAVKIISLTQHRKGNEHDYLRLEVQTDEVDQSNLPDVIKSVLSEIPGFTFKSLTPVTESPEPVIPPESLLPHEMVYEINTPSARRSIFSNIRESATVDSVRTNIGYYGTPNSTSLVFTINNLTLANALLDVLNDVVGIEISIVG